MYRLRPKLKVSKSVEVTQGIEQINKEVLEVIEKRSGKITDYETYPGVETEAWISDLKEKVDNALVVDTDDLCISAEEITEDLQEDLNSDEVFGRFSNKPFKKYLDPIKIKELYEKIPTFKQVIIVGIGATDVVEADFIVYLDIARWETQLKHRSGMKNWKS